jgi:hypothetical protein
MASPSLQPTSFLCLLNQQHAVSHMAQGSHALAWQGRMHVWAPQARVQPQTAPQLSSVSLHLSASTMPFGHPHLMLVVMRHGGRGWGGRGAGKDVRMPDGRGHMGRWRSVGWRCVGAGGRDSVAEGSGLPGAATLCPALTTVTFNADWQLVRTDDEDTELPLPHKHLTNVGLHGLAYRFGIGFAAVHVQGDLFPMFLVTSANDRTLAVLCASKHFPALHCVC